MKLEVAYLCIACNEINDKAPRGVCNRCGSDSVISLSRALSENPAAFLSQRLERFERSAAVERLERVHPVNGGRRPVGERL